MDPARSRRRDEALQRTLRGFFLSAAAMDGGFFLILVAMPFKVLDLGGGALELGLVGAVGALSYIVCAPLSGRWSDRGERALLSLLGAAVLVATAVLAWLVRRVDLLIALQALMGLGKALYWPAVQATLGDLSPGTRRLPVLGRFNLSWSGGKTLGFALGGLLLGCCGFGTVYLTGAVIVVVAVIVLPRGGAVDRARGAVAAAGDAESPAARPADQPERLRVFRAMGWIANTAAAGAFGILTYHLPQWFETRGWQPDRFGWFLGAVLAVQTVTFVLFTGRLKLAWSVWRLWAPLLVTAAAVAAIPLLPRFAGLLALAPAIGFGCGVCYTASIYYSLEAAATRGRNAGIHESLVGAGSFLPPLLAGGLVRLGLGLEAPYLLAGALLIGGLVLQAALWTRAQRSSGTTLS